MKKLSKQVLALGLASGVLLSGLPLGTVVEAASAGEVVKKTTKTVTTKEKLAKVKKEFEDLRFAYMRKVNVVWNKQAMARMDLDEASEYQYKVTDVTKRVLSDRLGELHNRLKGLDGTYSQAFWLMDEKLSDEKKLAEYTKRIERVKVLNAANGLGKLDGESTRLVEDASNVVSLLYMLSDNERARFESAKTAGTVLREKNEKWALGVYGEAKKVVDKYRKDLISSGKTSTYAEGNVRALTREFDTLIGSEFKKIGKLNGSYQDSFKRALNEKDSGNKTLVRLEGLNKGYGSMRDVLNASVADAYKDSKLKVSPIKFGLK